MLVVLAVFVLVEAVIFFVGKLHGPAPEQVEAFAEQVRPGGGADRNSNPPSLTRSGSHKRPSIEGREGSDGMPPWNRREREAR